MQIKSVEIVNFHNTKKAKYTFATYNYIWGPNGAGKSTIMEAIQLSLLSYLPGTNKNNTAIFEHAFNTPMEIKLTLTDGDNDVVVSRRWSYSKGKVNYEENITPDNIEIEDIIGNLELPILNFNEFLAMTANKQKDTLVSVLPSFKDSIRTRAYLTKICKECEDVESIIQRYPNFEDMVELNEDLTTAQSIHSVINEVTKEIPELRNIDDIKALNELLKEHQKSNKAEEKRLESTSQSLMYYDDYEGEEDIEVIKREIDKLTERKEALIAYNANADFVGRQKEELKKYEGLGKDLESDETYKSALAAMDEAELRIEALNLDKEKVIEEQASLKAEYYSDTKILDSNGICPLLPDNYKCEELESRMQYFDDHRNTVYQKQQEAQQKYDKILSDIGEQDKVVDKMRETVNRLKESYASRDKILSNLKDVETINETLTVDELKLEIDKLNDDLVKASANQSYQELLNSIQSQKFNIEMNSEFLKAVVKATGENGLQTELMVKPFERLESSMEEDLKEMGLESLGKPKFILKAAANSFNFGFERNSAFVPFVMLSSGEKCIFLLTFMRSIVSISDTKFKAILIDDLFDHLDDDRFETVINNITGLGDNVQFIFAGVKMIPNLSELGFNVIGLSY